MSNDNGSSEDDDSPYDCDICFDTRVEQQGGIWIPCKACRG